MGRIVQRLAPLVAVAVAVVALNATVSASASSTRANGPKTITLELPHPYTPVAPRGGTDEYRCWLLDPKVTYNQMITSVHFEPGSLSAAEVHHSILYWVPPALVADAKKLNDNGKGWTCFGGPGIGGAGTIADLGNTSWLGGWAPGQGLNKEPADTGVPLPVGSEIVMQIHYNLLVGDKPNQSKVVLTTVPEANSSLIPLHIDLYPTAIDIPCPTGQTGPLCSRSASLADIGHRFGQSAVNFDNLLEEICNNGTPVPSDTTSCNWPIPARSPTVYLWRITPHMHLLGESMTVTLNQGQSDQRVLLDEPYNFHDQRAWDMSTPVAINGGDTINVSCMFNPTNRLTDPYLKNLPPRYVMWADGSSDEMCLAIMGVTYSLPSGVTPAVAHASTGYSWPAQVSSSAAKASPAFLGTKDINKMVRDEKLLAQLQRVIGFCGVS